MPLVLTFAFIAGLLTIVAPCTLPVVPLVLGVGSGAAVGAPSASCSGSGRASCAFRPPGLPVGHSRALDGPAADRSALALAILGTCLAVPVLGDRLTGWLAPLGRLGSGVGARSDGLLPGMAVGAGIGIVWAPCVGPIMAAVLAAAATSGPTVQGLAVATAYVVGAALPLLAIAALGRRAVRAAGSPQRRAHVQQAFGALMLSASLVVVAGYDLPLETAVASALPDGWTNALTSVGQAPTVEQAAALSQPSRHSPRPPSCPIR